MTGAMTTEVERHRAELQQELALWRIWIESIREQQDGLRRAGFPDEAGRMEGAKRTFVFRRYDPNDQTKIMEVTLAGTPDEYVRSVERYPVYPHPVNLVPDTFFTGQFPGMPED